MIDVKTAIYRVYFWLRHQLTAGNTGGHGIHSPYLFEWVRLVMRGDDSYYVWSAIEDRRQAMLLDDRPLEYVDYGSGKRRVGDESKDKRIVKDIAKGSLSKPKYAQMLARLVNWLGSPLYSSPLRGGIGDEVSAGRKGLTIVELGTSLGMTTAYMAAMDSRNRVITYEGCPAVAEIAKANWNALGIKNIDCRVGEIDVAALAKDLECVDVAYVDANHTYASTCAYFNMLVEKVHEKSVIIVDDIHYSQEMDRAWREICADDRVTSTMDLYQMGLVFFDKHYWKQNYKLNI